MVSEKISIFLNSFLFKSEAFDFLVEFIANDLGYIIIVFLCAYYFFFIKKPKTFLKIIFFVGISWIVVIALKKFFGETRPFFVIPEIKPLFVLGGADSFPSGHATVFSALATLVYLDNRKLGYFYTFSAVFIGLTRIIAGVHYVHDILAGFALGVILALLMSYFYPKLRNKILKR